MLICLFVLGGPIHRCIFVFSTWVFDWGYPLLFLSPFPSELGLVGYLVLIFFFVLGGPIHRCNLLIYLVIYFPSSWVFFIGGFVFCPHSPPFSKPVSQWGWRRTWVYQQKLLIRPTWFTMNSAATISSKS